MREDLAEDQRTLLSRSASPWLSILCSSSIQLLGTVRVRCQWDEGMSLAETARSILYMLGNTMWAKLTGWT